MLATATRQQLVMSAGLAIEICMAVTTCKGAARGDLYLDILHCPGSVYFTDYEGQNEATFDTCLRAVDEGLAAAGMQVTYCRHYKSRANPAFGRAVAKNRAFWPSRGKSWTKLSGAVTRPPWHELSVTAAAHTRAACGSRGDGVVSYQYMATH